MDCMSLNTSPQFWGKQKRLGPPEERERKESQSPGWHEIRPYRENRRKVVRFLTRQTINTQKKKGMKIESPGELVGIG